MPVSCDACSARALMQVFSMCYDDDDDDDDDGDDYVCVCARVVYYSL